MTWERQKKRWLRHDRWIDDPEDVGGLMYAPDFLGFMVEVFHLLFPEHRERLYDAYIYWCRQRDIPPNFSSPKHGMTGRAFMSLAQRFLLHPREGFESFLDWCRDESESVA